jgi:hypothetical protein
MFLMDNQTQTFPKHKFQAFNLHTPLACGKCARVEQHPNHFTKEEMDALSKDISGDLVSSTGRFIATITRGRQVA